MRRLAVVLVGASVLVGTLAQPALAATRAKPVPRAASSGCRVSVATPPGETKESIDSDGDTYTYVQDVPPAYDGTSPLPVVVDFHGYAEGAAIHTSTTMLGAMGDTKGFVTITPQGQGAVAMWDTSLAGADVEFVGNLLDEVESTLCVDTNRVFATGYSNGAFMTSAVACAYADRVAAAAPVAGIRKIAACRPTRPVPVVAFHGTADGFVSFNGGLGEAAMNLPAPDGSGRTVGDLVAANPSARVTVGPSIPVIAAGWAKRNDCTPRPTRKKIGDDVTLVRYRCPKNATVELYRVQGGGHAWPGSAFSKAIAGVVGPTTFTISANRVMWRFFEEHPLRTS